MSGVSLLYLFFSLLFNEQIECYMRREVTWPLLSFFSFFAESERLRSYPLFFLLPLGRWCVVCGPPFLFVSFSFFIFFYDRWEPAVWGRVWMEGSPLAVIHSLRGESRYFHFVDLALINIFTFI